LDKLDTIYLLCARRLLPDNSSEEQIEEHARRMRDKSRRAALEYARRTNQRYFRELEERWGHPGGGSAFRG